jgi:hypothetical protein
MAPRDRKRRSSGTGPSRGRPSRVAQVALEAIEHYENHVPEDDKVAMTALEVEVRLVREFKEDAEINFQVGGARLYQNQKLKFFHTLELYWHVKTMVALGMLPKGKDFRQLKGKMEMLEIQDEYLLKVIT